MQGERYLPDRVRKYDTARSVYTLRAVSMSACFRAYSEERSSDREMHSAGLSGAAFAESRPRGRPPVTSRERSKKEGQMLHLSFFFV